MSLVFQKYVIGLGWRIACLPDGSATVEAPGPGTKLATFEPALACLESLVVQLEVWPSPNAVVQARFSTQYLCKGLVSLKCLVIAGVPGEPSAGGVAISSEVV